MVEYLTFKPSLIALNCYLSLQIRISISTFNLQLQCLVLFLSSYCVELDVVNIDSSKKTVAYREFQ